MSMLLNILEKIIIDFMRGKIEPLLTNYNASPSQHIPTATLTITPIFTTQESIVLKTSMSSFLPDPLLNCSLARIL